MFTVTVNLITRDDTSKKTDIYSLMFQLSYWSVKQPDLDEHSTCNYSKYENYF